MAPEFQGKSKPALVHRNPYGNIHNAAVGNAVIVEVTALAKLTGWVMIVFNAVFLLDSFLVNIGIIPSPNVAMAVETGLLLLVIANMRAAGILLGYLIKNGNMVAIIVANVLQGIVLVILLLILGGTSNGVAVLPAVILSGFISLFLLATATSQSSLNRNAKAREFQQTRSYGAPASQTNQTVSIPEASMKIICLACQLSDDLVDERTKMAVEYSEEIYGRSFSRELQTELDGILGNPAATDELQQWTPALSQTSNAALKKRAVQVVKKLLGDGSQESAEFYRQLLVQLGFNSPSIRK